MHASWVHNHMSPLLVTKHRSSLPVVRHEKTPWVISRTAGLADFVFFRAPWNVPPRWWPQFPQLGGLLRLKYSTWHLGHEPRPRLLITNTNQEQTTNNQETVQRTIHTPQKDETKTNQTTEQQQTTHTRPAQTDQNPKWKPTNNHKTEQKRSTHLKQMKTRRRNPI